MSAANWGIFFGGGWGGKFFFGGLKRPPKKGTQTQTFWSGFLRWGGGLPREGVGAKKFGMSFEIQANQLFFLRHFPGFRRDIQAVPEEFEKKKLCSILVP